MQSFFFFCAPLGTATFRRGQSKTKNTPRVFFFCSGSGERQGKEKPRAGTGSKKKNTTQGVFFCLRQGKEKPRWAPARGQKQKQKKKNTLGGAFFFALAPCRHGASPSPAFPRGRSKKKHPGWCFFVCCGPARTLTHSLRAWVAMPPPRRGGVFFLLRPRPHRGGVFFCCGPARTLTHSLWAGAISARPGWCFFFLLRPRRVFLDNNKKCLGYYIGSKKTRRGHSKKNNITSQP